MSLLIFLMLPVLEALYFSIFVTIAWVKTFCKDKRYEAAKFVDVNGGIHPCRPGYFLTHYVSL